MRKKQPDRVYTIPAREVVPRMLLEFPVGAQWEWEPVAYLRACRSLVNGKPCWEAFSLRGYRGSGPVLLDPDAMVDVRLPDNAKSPRELLCSCRTRVPFVAPDAIRTLPWREHAKSCPVRKLRLRLWPDALNGEPWTWDPGEGEDQHEMGWWAGDEFVAVAEIRHGWSDGMRLNVAEIRAAFCEPEEPTEVQP
jgi:hypothetical protein